MLTGIKNFLEIIDSNWTTILVIIGLALGIWRKAQDFFAKTTDKKIDIAKTQITETILKMITAAEIDFENWNQAGSIKRSQVIKEIFEQYPILSKVANQEEIISWIDTEINNSLKTLRKVVAENKSE